MAVTNEKFTDEQGVKMFVSWKIIEVDDAHLKVELTKYSPR